MRKPVGLGGNDIAVINFRADIGDDISVFIQHCFIRRHSPAFVLSRLIVIQPIGGRAFGKKEFAVGNGFHG